MSRRKELFLVTVINVMFAIYTRIFMGSMLYISLIEIGGITYSAMIGWFLYVCSLCVVLLWERRELYGWKKICLLSAGTSVVMVMMRAVFDYISDQFIWSIWSMLIRNTVRYIRHFSDRCAFSPICERKEKMDRTGKKTVFVDNSRCPALCGSSSGHIQRD